MKNTCYLIGIILLSIMGRTAWAVEESPELRQLKQQIHALQHQESGGEYAREHRQADSDTHAPKTAHQSSAKLLNAAAFANAVQNALPLSPQQITYLHQLFNQSQTAATTTPGTPPRPVIASRYINLSPGSTPMVIRLAQGYVSTLAFLDSSGQPWPIESYNIGNPQAFNIQWDKQGNLLMIQATTLYSTGNLVIQLRGLNTPVVLSLLSGQHAVDYRLDLRVSGMGPYAKPILGSSLPNQVHSELLEILDGIPPANSVNLQIVGGPAEAWLVKDRLYIRTRLTILSPAWIATVSSLDGMHVYELANTPVLLCTANGRPIQLQVKGL